MNMNFDEIMAELSKLTPEQRELLRIRLVELESGEWLEMAEYRVAIGPEPLDAALAKSSKFADYVASLA